MPYIAFNKRFSRKGFSPNNLAILQLVIIHTTSQSPTPGTSLRTSSTVACGGCAGRSFNLVPKLCWERLLLKLRFVVAMLSIALVAFPTRRWEREKAPPQVNVCHVNAWLVVSIGVGRWCNRHHPGSREKEVSI